MQRKRVFGLREWTMTLLVLISCAAAAAAQDKERVEYWRKNYGELRSDDPHAIKAQTIFQRLVQVAGTRPGVMPRLLITASDPWDIVLPIALPDGWIVLSKRALSLCYQASAQGDDRLAFVLAHEIAHQLNNDSWHIRFFTAKPQISLESIPEHVAASELRADEQGILYAAMAGFQPHAIVTGDRHVDFFVEWGRALEHVVGGVPGHHVRPTPQERAAALRDKLRQVADTTNLFQLGLWYYYAGDYPRAVQAFDAFRATFPSREVHHNLATSHHQLALQAYQKLPAAAPSFPWHLSLTIEPLTRASAIYLERTRGTGEEPAVVFRHHLNEAIRWYTEALTQEPDYPPAALNLGAALLLRGVQTPRPGPIHPDFAAAVARLSGAPSSPAILNTLGVTLWYDGRPDPAKTTLAQAQALAPDYAAPVCNLGAMARLEHRDAEVQQYMDTCTRLTARSATVPGQSTPEPIHGITLGTVESSLPASVGTPMRNKGTLAGTPFTLATYPAGVMTLAREGDIVMLMARDGYQGSSARGLALGSQGTDVLARYGPPSRRYEMTQGQSWAYDTQRIAFQLRAGRVVSWLVF